MDEKIVAIENVIFEFARGQFEANGISPIIAKLIMEGVYSKFQGFCLDAFIMSRIETNTPQEEVKKGQRSGTGSIQDFVNDLNAFYGQSAHEEGENGGTEDSTAQA